MPTWNDRPWRGILGACEGQTYVDRGRGPSGPSPHRTRVAAPRVCGRCGVDATVIGREDVRRPSAVSSGGDLPVEGLVGVDGAVEREVLGAGAAGVAVGEPHRLAQRVGERARVVAVEEAADAIVVHDLRHAAGV